MYARADDLGGLQGLYQCRCCGVQFYAFIRSLAADLRLCSTKCQKVEIEAGRMTGKPFRGPQSHFGTREKEAA